MALRIWLPLNNSFVNYGCSDVTVGNQGGSFSNTWYARTAPYFWVTSATSRISVPYQWYGTNQISFAMWVCPRAPSAWSSIFGWEGADNRVEVSTSQSTYYFFGGSNALIANSTQLTSGMVNGTWNHIALVADGTNVRFYRNGNLVNTVAQANTVATSFNNASRNIWFGGYSDNYNGYYQDIRVYDNAISAKEVKELSQGLAFHYPMTDSVSYSRIANSGTAPNYNLSKVGSPVNTTATTGGRHVQSINFNKSGYYRDTSVGMRFNMMTMSFWFYPKDTTGSTQHFLFGSFADWDSSGPTTGIAFWRDVGNNKYNISFKLDGDSTPISITCPTFSYNAWHHMVLTWNEYGESSGTRSFKIYLDGVLKTSTTLSSSATQCIFSNLYLGNSRYSNAPTSEIEDVMMSDFRLYSTALLEADVLALYNTPISIAKNGGLHAVEMYESGSTVMFRKTGVVQASNFMDLYHTEPDGSRWVMVAMHSNPTSYKFSSSDTFSTFVYKDNNRYFQGRLCDHVNRWEFLVLQKQKASSSVEKYRWVQTKNPNTASFADVASANVTKNTSSGYSSTSYGGIYKYNSSTYYCANNGTSGNWFGAVGSWNEWNGGIPGWEGKAIVDGGGIVLYLRIDGGATWNYTQTERMSIVKANKSISEYELIEQ